MRCFYCGCELEDRAQKLPWQEYLEEKRARTWDHFIPSALGGSTDRHNLVQCCSPCNGAKGETLPSLAEIVRFIQERPLGDGPLPLQGRIKRKRMSALKRFKDTMFDRIAHSGRGDPSDRAAD